MGFQKVAELWTSMYVYKRLPVLSASSKVFLFQKKNLKPLQESNKIKVARSSWGPAYWAQSRAKLRIHY